MLKKIVTVITVTFLCLCMSITTFASEEILRATTNEQIINENTSPKAISGSGQCTTSGYTEFTIYSPAWSLWGHAQITVSGGTAVIGIVAPNGNSAIDGGTVLLSPGNHRVGLINTKAGTYSVHVQSAYGESVTVKVELKDF